MRYIILSLLLLSAPIQAEQILNKEECLILYKTFLADFEASQTQPATQMVYFGEMCMPSGSVSEQILNPRYEELLTALANDAEITALESRLVELRLRNE